MSLDEYSCEKCGAKFGIFGESTGSDDDLDADMYYEQEIQFHRSGDCTPAPVESTERVEYVKGLRALADLLEANEAVPLPYTGRQDAMQFYDLGDPEESKANAAMFARVFPGKLNKVYRDDIFELSGHLHGLAVDFAVYRNAVCRRVVTGTQEITKTVPAPGAPMVEITETIDVVEWICAEPLLAAEAGGR